MISDKGLRDCTAMLCINVSLAESPQVTSISKPVFTALTPTHCAVV